MSAAGMGDLPAPPPELPAGDASSSEPFSIRDVDILAHVPIILDYDGDHYAEWKSAMLSVLAQFDATDHIEEHGRAQHGEEYEEWTRADVTVVLWIYITISDELLDEVMAAHTTAYELWAQLRDFFDYGDEHGGFDAGAELRNAVQGDMSVADYCWRLEALAEALVEQGEPVDERVVTLQMIRGVNPRFLVTAAKLLVRARFPSFMEAFAWLNMEEYNLKHGQGAE